MKYRSRLKKKYLKNYVYYHAALIFEYFLPLNHLTLRISRFSISFNVLVDKRLGFFPERFQSWESNVLNPFLEKFLFLSSEMVRCATKSYKTQNDRKINFLTTDSW